MRDRRAIGRDQITIRALQMHDLDDFVTMSNQPGVVFGTLQLPWTSTEQRRERFARMLASDTVHMLAAEVEGHVVGTISLHCHSGARMRHAAEIGMSVHDDYQGIGIGTALMEAAVELAEKWLNIMRLELSVNVDNEPALALYRKFGFVIEGTRRKSVFRDGEFVDCHLMARLRQAP